MLGDVGALPIGRGPRPNFSKFCQRRTFNSPDERVPLEFVTAVCPYQMVKKV